MIQFSRNTQGHKCDTSAFSRAKTKDVRRVHGMIAGYAPTALRNLPVMAKRLGVRAVFIKDESTRFGLKAFKGLGGIYGMYRMICEALELDPEAATLDRLRTSPYAAIVRPSTAAAARRSRPRTQSRSCATARR